MNNSTRTIDKLVEGIARFSIAYLDRNQPANGGLEQLRFIGDGIDLEGDAIDLENVPQRTIQNIEKADPLEITLSIYDHDKTKTLTDLLLKGYKSHFRTPNKYKLVRFGVAWSIWSHMLYKRKSGDRNWFNHPFEVAREILEQYSGKADPALIAEALIHDSLEERIANKMKRVSEAEGVQTRAEFREIGEEGQDYLKDIEQRVRIHAFQDLKRSLETFVETRLTNKRHYRKEVDRLLWVTHFTTKPAYADYFSYLQRMFFGIKEISNDAEINKRYSPQESLELWKNVLGDAMQIKFSDRKNNSETLATFGDDVKLVNYYKNILLLVQVKRYLTGTAVISAELKQNQHLVAMQNALLETTIEGLKALEKNIYERGKYVLKGVLGSFKDVGIRYVKGKGIELTITEEMETDGRKERKTRGLKWEDIKHQWLYRNNQMFFLKNNPRFGVYDKALALYEYLGGLNAVTDPGETKIDRERHPLLYQILEAPERSQVPVLKLTKYLSPGHYLYIPLSHFDGTMERWAARIHDLKEDTSEKWPLKQYYKDAIAFRRIAERLKDDSSYFPDLSSITPEQAKRYYVTTK